jgi:glyoxylase-like metal-dependent hydrolase (beta-lactamase superfamily II)
MIPRRALFCLASIVSILTSSLVAQTGGAQTDQSYHSALEARRVVERAIAAIGGLAALDSVHDIARILTGERIDIGQALRPSPPYTREPVTVKNTTELKSGRMVDELTHGVLGAGTSHTVLIVQDRNNSYFVTRSGRGTAVPTLTSFGRPIPVPYRYPELLLPLVLGRISNARFLGQQSGDVRNYNVVSFADPHGTIFTLLFDDQTGLLSKFSWLLDEPTYSIAGELPRELTYSDYRQVHGLTTPFHYTVRYGGELLENLQVTDFKINTNPADAFFDLPTDPSQAFSQSLAYSPQGVPLRGGFGANVNKLGDDVYWVRAPYNSFFVVFNDYVLVVEAPLNDLLSQQTIAAIKKVAPGKRIGYLVVTHAHHDHIGGVRGFVAEGTTIVTASGVKSEIERLVAEPHSLNPDTLSLHPASLKIETFTDRRVFSDTNHRVELYNVGPNPHSDDLLVAYIPSVKTLYEADALDLQSANVAPAAPTTIDLLHKIQALGLDVQTIIPTHGRSGTIDDLKTAVSLAARDAAGQVGQITRQRLPFCRMFSASVEGARN